MAIAATETSSDAPRDRPWVAIVGNPYSGAGANRERVEALSRALHEWGLEVRAFWDLDARRHVLGSARARERICCVVVAGGDGTVADVFNECADLPVAILPLGNENCLARELGLRGDPEALARAIAEGRRHRLDLGVANGRLFSLMVTAGPDADVVRRFAECRSLGGALCRSSRLAYVGHAIASALSYRFPEIELEADGERVSGTGVYVFNVPGYALGLRFTPDARDDDGLLDWLVFQGRGPLRLACFHAAVATGRHLRWSDVRYGRARRVRLRSISPVPVQIDGEAAGTTPVDIGIRPLAGEVIVGNGRATRDRTASTGEAARPAGCEGDP